MPNSPSAVEGPHSTLLHGPGPSELLEGPHSTLLHGPPVYVILVISSSSFTTGYLLFLCFIRKIKKTGAFNNNNKFFVDFTTEVLHIDPDNISWISWNCVKMKPDNNTVEGLYTAGTLCAALRLSWPEAHWLDAGQRPLIGRWPEATDWTLARGHWLDVVRLHTCCTLSNQCAEVKAAVTTHTQGETPCMGTLIDIYWLDITP